MGRSTTCQPCSTDDEMSGTRRPRADPGLTTLDATTLAGVVAQGKATADEVTRAFLDRIAAEEGIIGAWAHLDPEHALQQAAALDRHRRSEEHTSELQSLMRTSYAVFC